MDNSRTLVGAATAILLVILVGLFVLLWHGSFTGEAVLAVVTGIVTALLGIFGVHSGVAAGTKAALLMPTLPTDADATSTSTTTTTISTPPTDTAPVAPAAPAPATPALGVTP